MPVAPNVGLTPSGKLVTRTPSGRQFTWPASVTSEFVRLLARPTPMFARSFVLGDGDHQALAVTLNSSGAVYLRRMLGKWTSEGWMFSYPDVMALRMALGLLEPREGEPLAAAMNAQLQTWGPSKAREQHIAHDAWRAGALARLAKYERNDADLEFCWCGLWLRRDFAGYLYCVDDSDEHEERLHELKRGGRLTRSGAALDR